MMALEKSFNIARHRSVKLIINGFNVFPVSLTVVCNLFYMIQNIIKKDKIPTANCSSVFKV